MSFVLFFNNTAGVAGAVAVAVGLSVPPATANPAIADPVGVAVSVPAATSVVVVQAVPVAVAVGVAPGYALPAIATPVPIGVSVQDMRIIGPFDVSVLINGQEHYTEVLPMQGAPWSTLAVSEALNDEPDTATLRVKGFVPREGHAVEIAHGFTKLFGGSIGTRTQLNVGSRANVEWELYCVDWTRLLNRRLVNGVFTGSVYDILLAIVATFTSGFTTVNVSAALSAVTLDGGITYTDEPAASAIARLMKRAGGYYFVDADRDVHAFLVDATNPPNPVTDASTPEIETLVIATDVLPVRTRVIVEGGGSLASVEVAPGASTLPVDDASWYAAAGGTVKVETQRPTYTGKSSLDGTGSTVAGQTLAPGTPSAAVVAGVAGKLSAGAYQYQAAFVLPTGESEVGAASSSATITSISSPSAPSGTQLAGASGNLVVGAYTYLVAYRTAAGRSAASSASGSVSISDISAPSAPSGSVVSEAPGNLRTGTFKYKATYETAAGETVASSESSGVAIANVSAPGALTNTAATVTGGGLTAGFHTYGVTYLTAAGETTLGSTSTNVELTGGQNAFVLTNIPISTDDRVIGRRIYRTPAGGGGGSDYKFVGQINDNIQASFTDVVADASRGAEDPSANTSGSGKITVTIPTSGDGRVTRRQIYRTEVDGSTFYHLTTVNDNTDTSFLDNIADELLGGIPPAVGTAGTGKITVTIPVSADGRVMGRVLFRKLSTDTVYRKVLTVGENTSTSVVDNVAEASLGDPENVENTGTSGTGQIAVSAVPIGPAGTTARDIYRTEAGGSVFKFLRTLAGNVATSFTDDTADSSLGEAAPVGSTVGALAGETSLRVKDLAAYPAGGWVRAGDQIIRFTGRSASSGEGTLTGIPASGVGAIGAGLAANVSVVNHPHLTGVSGVVATITDGAEVNLLVTLNDVAAQAALAVLEGGDGIHEHPVQDRRLALTTATVRGQAELTRFKSAIVTVTYDTHDPLSHVGKTIGFNLGAPTNLVGDFLIQRVTRTEFTGLPGSYPRCRVEASNVKFSLEDLLRRALLEQGG